MKKPQLCLFLTLLTAASGALAWDFGKPKETYLNVKESEAQSLSQVQVLRDLQEEMTSRFTLIETELARGSTQEALTAAKNVLDTVKIKTGIDPKKKIQEKFLIATKFPEGALSMGDLNVDQRELVIKTISNYRGGLYLDIMNLSKRTTLLYIRAFQAQLAQAGGLTAEDREKIINDLIKASLVPMQVEDKDRKRILVFDEDVTNEDHSYLFNRELKMFLLKNPEVNVTEQGFNLRKDLYKQSQLLALKEETKTPAGKESGQKCMKAANDIEHSYHRNNAKWRCFYNHYHETSSMNECSRLAKKIENAYTRNNAKNFCFTKFNR